MEKSTKTASKKIVKTIEPIVEVKEVQPVVDEVKAEVLPVVEAPSIPVVEVKEEAVELSNEEKLLAYIEKSISNPVRINDFLKSLYPLQRFNDAPVWKQLGASKEMKVMLTRMSDEGKISIVGNSHLNLGKPYHHGEQQLSANYNLDNVVLLAQK